MVGGLQHFSVRPLGFGFGTKGFGAKGVGPGLDNKKLYKNQFEKYTLSASRIC